MTIGKIFYNPIIIFFISVFAIVAFLQLDQTTKKTQLSHTQVAEKEKIVQNMANKVTALEDQFSEVNSDYYKEKVIRDELLLQKENEIILKLPEILEQKKVVENKQLYLNNFAKWHALFIQ